MRCDHCNDTMDGVNVPGITFVGWCARCTTEDWGQLKAVMPRMQDLSDNVVSGEEFVVSFPKNVAILQAVPKSHRFPGDVIMEAVEPQKEAPQPQTPVDETPFDWYTYTHQRVDGKVLE